MNQKGHHLDFLSILEVLLYLSYPYMDTAFQATSGAGSPDERNPAGCADTPPQEQPERPTGWTEQPQQGHQQLSGL